MLQSNPRLSRADPFHIDLVTAAADHVFDISRFYDEDSSESEASDSDDEEDSSTSPDEDSEDDESESEEENVKKSKLASSKTISKAKAKARKLKSKAKNRDESITHPLSTTSKASKEIDEVAELIEKLGRLNINDPSYPSLYFRIISKAPDTTSFLAKPRQRSYDGTPQTNASSSSQQQSTNNGTFECFFCGEKGHGLQQCNQAEEMIKAGTISRNNNRKIIWADGSSILQSGGETILAAINRELTFRSRVNTERSTCYELI
jgi:hypothetical protein